MAIVRWRPMRDLLNIRDEMDRVFSDFFGDISERRPSEFEGLWSPNVDISEKENEITATVELPGIKKDDVKISVQNNVLNIRGEKKQEKEEKHENYHRVERGYGSFQRSFSLPTSVDPNKIKANYKNGVLIVKMPKVEEAKRKEIPISVE